MRYEASRPSHNAYNRPPIYSFYGKLNVEKTKDGYFILTFQEDATEGLYHTWKQYDEIKEIFNYEANIEFEMIIYILYGQELGNL